METPFVHLNSHATVSISERHSVERAPVHFFHGEKMLIQRRVKDVLFDYDVLQHIVCHEQTLVHQFEGREKYVLEQLEITVIPVRHVAAQQADFIFSGHYPVAIATHYLPYVRVLLMWHDAGACGKLIREFYETIIRTHIHAAVCREFVERERYGSHG